MKGGIKCPHHAYAWKQLDKCFGLMFTPYSIMYIILAHFVMSIPFKNNMQNRHKCN